MKLYCTLIGKLFFFFGNFDGVVQVHLKQWTHNDPTDANLHFCCIVSCLPESSSHRPRSISCWFTTLMPFFMIKNTATLHASTAWPCNRRRSSAKHPKCERLRAELQPTSKRRYGGGTGACRARVEGQLYTVAFWLSTRM